ncbi:hypothetical protein BDP27DRAFT_552994 [Rhodocollybia butyracea]|uniref:DUF7082 domain-containing protein n=1 Tax=Rhodocollybia butyracea TaxID=206335 RepID=A0A9P5U9L0_9AGAR|nr:hypothetical protein BDP27DRAFT_552994 [Rhodocollybia butyracea]
MSLQNPTNFTFPIPSATSASHSPNNMIHVLEYSPKEGERGVPITVRLHFNHSSSDAVFLRLVVGTRPLPTKVRELPNVTYGNWQLDATAPSFEGFDSDKVLLSVQALDQNNQVMDTVTFGEFTYWISNNNIRVPPSHIRRSSVDSKLGHLSPGNPSTFVGRRRANTISSTASPAMIKSESPKPRANKKEGRRIRVNSLMRAKYPVSDEVDEELYAQTPILQLVTSLDAMCAAWEPAEHRAGRRLVRFTKVQDGRKLIVSCEPVSQEDYRENESVISCIYREESQTYFVTSVDIIYLLERLTNDEFPVEEKNRIRRNLEGLRPTTVSKHKPDFEKFFTRIMEFPDPKPRNIEKDLKVFEWSLLGQALDKILSKYHIYTSSPTDSTVSLPMEPPDEATSYSIDHQVVLSNTSSDEYPELVHPTPTTALKFEPGLYDDRSLLFLHQPESLESLCPPSSTPSFSYHSEPRSTSETRHHQIDDDVLAGNWTSTEHMGMDELGIGDYRSLTNFQLVEGNESVHPDYGIYHHGYGPYTFHGMNTEGHVPSYY